MRFLTRISILIIVGWSSIFINSCTTSEVHLDPELSPYIGYFESDINKKIPETLKYKLRLTFKSLRPGVIGSCKPYTREIFISPNYWFRATIDERLALVYHELGHCVCMKDHNNLLLQDGCPYSIMHKSEGGNICYKRHWKHYVQELSQSCLF